MSYASWPTQLQGKSGKSCIMITDKPSHVWYSCIIKKYNYLHIVSHYMILKCSQLTIRSTFQNLASIIYMQSNPRSFRPLPVIQWIWSCCWLVTWLLTCCTAIYILTDIPSDFVHLMVLYHTTLVNAYCRKQCRGHCCG